MLSTKEIAYRRWMSFQNHARAHGYPIDRGFEARRDVYAVSGSLSEYLSGYDDDLPKYNGSSLSQLIDERVRMGMSFNLADLGCGRGRVMITSALRWSGYFTEGLGINARFDEPRPDLLDQLPGRTTAQKLANARIRILELDVQDPSSFRGEDGKYEFVVSNKVARHVVDPWSLVQNAWNITAEGGIGLISSVPIPEDCMAQPKNCSSELQEFLTSKGVIVAASEEGEMYWTLAFRKEGEIKMPLVRVGLEGGSVDRFAYAFGGKE